MDNTMTDKLLVRELVERWAVWRDAGDWERFASVWHPDGVMMATWFQGPFEDFIRVTREGWMAWQVPAHGTSAVVSHHANGYHQKVVDSLVDRGCTATGNDASTRFSVTRMDCPAALPSP